MDQRAVYETTILEVLREIGSDLIWKERIPAGDTVEPRPVSAGRYSFVSLSNDRVVESSYLRGHLIDTDRYIID